MTVKELEITEDDLGVFAMSIVDIPAIKENFVYLRDQKEPITLKEVDKEKRLLLGPALIPNKPVFRKGMEGEEDYYIYFNPSTIEKAAHDYLRNSMHLNHTLMHEKKLTDLAVVESWIIDDELTDKSRKYGFDLPKGTWMLMVHVGNEKVWQEQVKTGKVKGFSIEGNFGEVNPTLKAVSELCVRIENTALK